ncbi:MAG: PEGA domain-containing protein, partial [Labilithrix sp.]|nr:PEGA domain-containing protein [Labilithrix sp.]
SRAAPPAAPSPEGRGAVGYLTLDTYPWTRVTMNGKALGDTPLVRVQLPPGTHTLVLENAAEKIRQTTVVTIKAGESVSRRLAF